VFQNQYIFGCHVHCVPKRVFSVVYVHVFPKRVFSVVYVHCVSVYCGCLTSICFQNQVYFGCLRPFCFQNEYFRLSTSIVFQTSISVVYVHVFPKRVLSVVPSPLCSKPVCRLSTSIVFLNEYFRLSCVHCVSKTNIFGCPRPLCFQKPIYFGVQRHCVPKQYFRLSYVHCVSKNHIFGCPTSIVFSTTSIVGVLRPLCFQNEYFRLSYVHCVSQNQYFRLSYVHCVSKNQYCRLSDVHCVPKQYWSVVLRPLWFPKPVLSLSDVHCVSKTSIVVSYVIVP